MVDAGLKAVDERVAEADPVDMELFELDHARWTPVKRIRYGWIAFGGKEAELGRSITPSAW